MRPTSQKLLIGYSAVLTTLLTALTVTEAASGPAKVAFEEIDVQRINVREKDGTLRMVIHSSGKQPGIINKGVEFPHPGRKAQPTAGMLFYNDEGSENGGLTYTGRRNEKGQPTASAGLTFDQYDQDQVVMLGQSDAADGRHRASLIISDRPDKPMPYEEMVKIAALSPAEQKAAIDRLIAEGRIGNKSRIFIGKNNDKSSAMSLNDAEGRPRIVMMVKADGAATIEFWDETGKPVRTLKPAEG